MDPLGLFEKGDRLELGDGIKGQNGKVTQQVLDIIDLQTRLVGLGYLYPSGFEFGSFDQATLDAVNAFKGSIKLDNKKKNKGVVGQTSWKALGLYFESEKEALNSAKQELAGGELWAKNNLLNVITIDQKTWKWFTINNNKVPVYHWSYLNFTYGTTYMEKLECAMGNADLANLFTSGIDAAVGTWYNYQEYSQAVSPDMWSQLAALGLSVTQAVWEESSGCPSLVDTSEISKYATNKAVNKAQENLEKVVTSHLLYVFDMNNVGANQNLKNQYVNQVALLTNGIAWTALKEGTGYDAEKMRMAAMEYILEVNRLNVRTKYRKAYLDQLL